MQCSDIRYIPIEYTDINDKRMTPSEAINYALQREGDSEFVKIDKLNDSLYLVVKE